MDLCDSLEAHQLAIVFHFRLYLVEILVEFTDGISLVLAFLCDLLVLMEVLEPDAEEEYHLTSISSEIGLVFGVDGLVEPFELFQGGEHAADVVQIVIVSTLLSILFHELLGEQRRYDSHVLL